MKFCVALLALLAVTVAQRDFGDLIHHEVLALLQADSSLTEDQCTTKCDALFDLVDAHDEQYTDDLCKHACDCEIHKDCGQHTHPPHQTHAPHPSQRPPHHGNQP